MAGKAESVAFVKCRFDVRKDDFRMLITASGSDTW
jgi:hypothetical protein